MSQNLSKSVKQFERRSRKCVKGRSLIRFVNIGHNPYFYKLGRDPLKEHANL